MTIESDNFWTVVLEDGVGRLTQEGIAHSILKKSGLDIRGRANAQTQTQCWPLDESWLTWSALVYEYEEALP